MNRRKEIINEYKARKLCGGVYIINNMENGKFLLGHAANLKSVQNHFEFARMTGSAVHPKLKRDWDALGAQAFRLEVLEELEQKPAQSQAEFMEDLQTLEQLWHEKFDAAKEY
jgi:hypothetical protein